MFIFNLLGMIFWLSAHAHDSSCGDMSMPVKNESELGCLVTELIHDSFPELNDAQNSGRIEFKKFESNEFYLQTNIKRIVDEKGKHRFKCIIEYNAAILEENSAPIRKPSQIAIQGILAHELVHLVDYETSMFSSLVRLGLDRLLFRHRYERRTDERAFERGYALGIKAYRIWIYSVLGKSQLYRKKKSYYTPEEIDRWMNRKTLN